MSETPTITVGTATPNAIPTPATPVVENKTTPVQADSTTPVETKVEPKQELASTRFAALAKKEAKLQAEREALKAEREGLSPVQAQIKAFEDAKKEALKNPLKFLEEAGLTLDQVNDYFLSGGQQSDNLKISEVDRKIEEFRKEQQAERDKVLAAEKTKLEAEQAQVVENWTKSIVDFVADNAEKYELTKLYNQELEVRKVIELHFEETNEVMATDKAADLVEQYLEELASKALETKKIKAKAQPQPQVAQQQAPKPSISNRTISSSLTPASQSSRSISNHSGSDALASAVARYHELARKN
jgi:hypothetical protein